MLSYTKIFHNAIYLLLLHTGEVVLNYWNILTSKSFN